MLQPRQERASAKERASHHAVEIQRHPRDGVRHEARGRLRHLHGAPDAAVVRLLQYAYLIRYLAFHLRSLPVLGQEEHRDEVGVGVGVVGVGVGVWVWVWGWGWVGVGVGVR